MAIRYCHQFNVFFPRLFRDKFTESSFHTHLVSRFAENLRHHLFALELFLPLEKATLSNRITVSPWSLIRFSTLLVTISTFSQILHNFGYKSIMLKTRKMMKNHLGTTRWWISCGLWGSTFSQPFWSLWVSADEWRSSTLELNDSLLTFTKVDFPLHPCTILSMPHWINQDSDASLTLAYWCHSWGG